MRNKILATLFIITLSLSGCVNPSIVNVSETSLSTLSVQSIYVPRFEGNPNFVEESTDYFVVSLEAQIDIPIIQGNVIRAEGVDIHSGSNMAAKELAIKAAKEYGADVVIMGKVTSNQSVKTFNGFATVRLISADTGEVLARFHRPSGMLFGNGVHQAVLAAVKRTAKDVANALSNQ